MKRFFALALLLCASVLGAQAQGLDDQYVQIFSLIQEADSLSASQPAKALAKYVDAQTALQRLQKGNPDWNPKVVSFRLAISKSTTKDVGRGGTDDTIFGGPGNDTVSVLRSRSMFVQISAANGRSNVFPDGGSIVSSTPPPPSNASRTTPRSRPSASRRRRPMRSCRNAAAS